MMVDPPVTELLKKVDSRYKLVIATSKRARQLAQGDKPLTEKREDSVVTLASVEIDEGKVFIDSDADNTDNENENEK